MSNLTPDGLRMVAEVASRHGVSLEAAFAVLDLLALSNGTQAQFNHPDLGGMGQWSRRRHDHDRRHVQSGIETSRR